MGWCHIKCSIEINYSRNNLNLSLEIIIIGAPLDGENTGRFIETESIHKYHLNKRVGMARYDIEYPSNEIACEM